MQQEDSANWRDWRLHQDAGPSRARPPLPAAYAEGAGPEGRPPLLDAAGDPPLDMEALLRPRTPTLRPPGRRRDVDPAAAPTQVPGWGARLSDPSGKGKAKAEDGWLGGSGCAEGSSIWNRLLRRSESARRRAADEDAEFDEAIASLIRTRRWLRDEAERSSKVRRARVELRRKAAEALKVGVAMSPEQAAAYSFQPSRPPLLMRRQQAIAQAQAPAQAQQQQFAPSQQPAPQPAATAQSPSASQATATPAATQAAASPTPEMLSVTPALEVPMESSPSVAQQLSTVILGSASPTVNASTSSAPVATSTPLPLVSPTLAPLLNSASALPSSSGNGGTGHNIGFILIVSVGSAIVAATLIGGLAWMFRPSSKKNRVNKRKRLEPGNWSPGAGSSIFSLRDAEKVLLGGSTLDSPMPALTSSSALVRRPRDTVSAAHLEPMPAVSGRGWTLFDAPMPRRGSSAQDARLGLGLAPQRLDQEGSGWIYQPGGQRPLQAAADEREQDADRDMSGIWPPATRRPSIMERLLHKRSMSDGLPLQHSHSQAESAYSAMRRRSAEALEQPTATSWSMHHSGSSSGLAPVSFSDPFAASSPSRQKSTGVLSSLSSAVLKAAGLSRGHSAESSALQHQAGASAPAIVLGRSDSQLPQARRLTKTDPRFRCDESTTTEDTGSSILSPAGSAQQANRTWLQAHGLTPALSSYTPGLAGIGSAFRSQSQERQASGPIPHDLQHLCDVQVHAVRVPEPALVLDSRRRRPLAPSVSLPTAPLGTQQLQRQQALLVGSASAALAAEPEPGCDVDDEDEPQERRRLEASIAKWQARSAGAGAPLDRRAPRSSAMSSTDSSSSTSSPSSAASYETGARGRKALRALRRAAHGTGRAATLTRDTTTSELYSPVTSISEGSSVSVRAAKRAAAEATAALAALVSEAQLTSTSAASDGDDADARAEEANDTIRFDRAEVDAFWAAEKEAAAATLAAVRAVRRRDALLTANSSSTGSRSGKSTAKTQTAPRSTATSGPDLTAMAHEIDVLLGRSSGSKNQLGATPARRSRSKPAAAHAPPSEVSISSASDISHRRWPAAPGQQEVAQMPGRRTGAAAPSAPRRGGLRYHHSYQSPALRPQLPRSSESDFSVATTATGLAYLRR